MNKKENHSGGQPEWPRLIEAYVLTDHAALPLELFHEFEKLVRRVVSKYPAGLYSPLGETSWTRDALDKISIETLEGLIRRGYLVRLYREGESRDGIEAYLVQVVRQKLRSIYNVRFPNHAKMFKRVKCVLENCFMNTQGQYWSLRRFANQPVISDEEVEHRLANIDPPRPSACNSRISDDAIHEFLIVFMTGVGAPVRRGKIVTVVNEYFGVSDWKEIGPSDLKGKRDSARDGDPGFSEIRGNCADARCLGLGYEIGQVATAFVSRLTDRQVAVFCLYYVDGQGVEKGAQVLGCSKSTFDNEKLFIESLLRELGKYLREDESTAVIEILKNIAEQRRKGNEDMRNGQEASHRKSRGFIQSEDMPRH